MKDAFRRNLLYHVAPFPGDAWRRNVAQVVRRIGLFDGRRVVSIARGPGLDDPDLVRAAFGDAVSEFVVLPNDHKLRERAAFLELLSRVESLDPREASFFAHAKGVATRGNPEGVVYWRNLMYHALLDDPARVATMLAQFPIVGTHRRRDVKRLPDGLPCPWHFSGTFFWLRHDAFFSRAWRSLPATGYAVEACPGLLFKFSEGCCLAKDNCRNPYDPAAYAGNERIPDPDGGPDVPPGIRVELGGGVKPRGDGYVNVDSWEGADVVFDLETLSADVRLPFADDAVSALYTSHCLEHVRNIVWTMREIVRVCRVGAVVEVRVPHWNSAMAMCHDHKQTFARAQVDHWTKSALAYWWAGGPKRLALEKEHYVPSPNYSRWKQLLPRASHDDLVDLLPDAIHESRWTFRVVPNT